MESKSNACVVTSLSVAFIVMLLIAVCAHAVMHRIEPTPEDLKSFAVVVPGTESAFNFLNVAVWGVVASVGAGAKTAASYLLTHFHR
jgi:hypothetical protein